MLAEKHLTEKRALPAHNTVDDNSNLTRHHTRRTSTEREKKNASRTMRGNNAAREQRSEQDAQAATTAVHY